MALAVLAKMLPKSKLRAAILYWGRSLKQQTERVDADHRTTNCQG